MKNVLGELRSKLISIFLWLNLPPSEDEPVKKLLNELLNAIEKKYDDICATLETTNEERSHLRADLINSQIHVRKLTNDCDNMRIERDHAQNERAQVLHQLDECEARLKLDKPIAIHMAFPNEAINKAVEELSAEFTEAIKDSASKLECERETVRQLEVTIAQLKAERDGIKSDLALLRDMCINSEQHIIALEAKLKTEREKRKKSDMHWFKVVLETETQIHNLIIPFTFPLSPL